MASTGSTRTGRAHDCLGGRIATPCWESNHLYGTDAVAGGTDPPQTFVGPPPVRVIDRRTWHEFRSPIPSGGDSGDDEVVLVAAVGAIVGAAAGQDGESRWACAREQEREGQCLLEVEAAFDDAVVQSGAV